MFEFEEKFLALKKKNIVGIDEAGRGPLAGCVSCAAVILPLDKNSRIEGVNDSKKLSEKIREKLFNEIIKKAISYSVVFVDEKEIDRINILNATKQGMLNAVLNLSVKPDILLIDAVKLNTELEQEVIIKGDEKSYSIAAASILAKVTRDRYMHEQAKIFPQYLFEKHKGYATAEHIQKLKEFGPCQLHRQTFLKNFLNTEVINKKFLN